MQAHGLRPLGCAELRTPCGTAYLASRAGRPTKYFGPVPDVLRPRAALGLPAFCGAQSLRCGRSRGTRPYSFGTRSPLKPGSPTAVGAGGSRPPVDGQRSGRFNLTWTVNCPSTGSPDGTVPRGRGTVAPAVWPTRPFGCEHLRTKWLVSRSWTAPV